MAANLARSVLLLCLLLTFMHVALRHLHLDANASVETAKVKAAQTRAMLALSKAEQTARSLPERSARVLMLALLGKEYLDAEDNERARKLFEEADEMLADKSLARSYTPTIIAEGYLQLGRLDTALQVASSYEHEDWTLGKIAEALIERGQLADAERVCNKIETATVYRPMGMLAYAYYQKGKQTDVERVIKRVSGESESACVFYRDTFAAQAHWEMQQRDQGRAKALLSVAAYWQMTFENKQEKDFHKHSERVRWAKQQARAGDVIEQAILKERSLHWVNWKSPKLFQHGCLTSIPLGKTTPI